MAPIHGATYFPSLEKCLSGEELLISWRSAFSAITSNELLGSDHQAAIGKFLSDAHVLDLLSKPFDAYPPPSPASKNAFETKTSAINVTPSSPSQYDIKTIKEDAIWLSGSAQIDEISALRVVVEESQTRAYTQLLGPFSEDELTGIREAAGNSKFAAAIPVSLLSQGADPEAFQKQFDTQESRRVRIVETYLSERRHLMKCTERLFHACFFNTEVQKDDARSKSIELAPSWVESTGRTLLTKLLETASGDRFVLRCIGAIEKNFKSLAEGAVWFTQKFGTEEVDNQWAITQITEATHGMELIFQFLTYDLQIPSSGVVLAWFNLQQSFGFLGELIVTNEEQSIQGLVETLQAISIVVSLALLRLDTCVPFLLGIAELEPNASGEKPFILQAQTVLEIHNMLLSAADKCIFTAGPVILAWTVIVRSICYRVDMRQAQIEAALYEGIELNLPQDDFVQACSDIKDTFDDDNRNNPADILGRTAVNTCRVFDCLASLSSNLGNTTTAFFSNVVGAQMRKVVLELLKHAADILGYIPEIVTATISTLSGGQNYWDLLDSSYLYPMDDPIAVFLQEEDGLLHTLFKSAQDRYPFESLSFLQMVRSLASFSSSQSVAESRSVISLLEDIPIFTYAFPNNWTGYTTVQEEENTNNITSKHDISLFEPRYRGRDQTRTHPSQALIGYDGDFRIPAGSFGRIVSENEPKVGFWEHRYSGLKYFGKLLETYLTACDEVDATTHLPADRQSVSEMIDVLATLLLGIARSAQDNPNSREDALRVLEISSSGLSRNRDIISVVFDIFEQELQTQSALSGSEVPVDILISCVHFIHSMIPMLPGRVWPHLSRSCLLGAERGVGRMSVIVESVEVVSGRYEFLISCCRLYAILVEDLATNAVRRRSGVKSSARFRDGEDVGPGVPDHILSAIMLAFTRYFVDVLESTCSWKFSKPNDRQQIVTILGSSFNKVLRYAYGIEAGQAETSDIDSTKSKPKPEPKLMETLMASASHLGDTFLSSSSGALRFQSLLRSYYDGLETPCHTTYINRTNLWVSSVKVMLSFSKILLRVGVMMGRPPSQLESQLFKSSPLVARLYAKNDSFRQPVIAIFEALIVAASNSTSEPPSLLGHLGTRTAKNFLRVLSDLDKPLSRAENVTAIWHFLSVVVSSRQQWFANYLLTGKTARDALRKTSSQESSSALEQPPLATALGALSKIRETPRHEVLAQLEFIALAQNFWPWTVCESPKYVAFIKAISEFVGNLHPLQQSTKLETNIDSCYQTRIAAYIAEILAMHLFHSRQTGGSLLIKELSPNLSYFARFAVAVPGYNSSLHGNLKKNFEARYPGSSLSDLQRTTLEDHQFGKEYFYDIQLANGMLKLDQAWTGRKDDGLRNEVAHANVNLSLVDTQIALFQSWKFLAIELSGNLAGEPDLQKMLAKVVNDCLVANARLQPPEEIFSRLSQTRADFALVITQRLIQAKSSVPETKGILNTVWDTIRTLRQDFERPIPDADVLYYRSLLKLLFLAIRIHSECDPQLATENLRSSMRLTQNQSVIPTILDILKYAVSKGIRELASSIHDSPADSSPEDLALLTGILQSCLRVPGIHLCHSLIVNIMTADSTPRVAITLFSWSDSLAIAGDPIYGELAILFLLELSTMQSMAEQLALSGVLSHIASANITTYLRRSGVSPFADSAGLQRCYTIWSKGILPLCLNLLDAVGPSVAAEISMFLNQFPLLISQNESFLDAPDTNRIAPRGKPKYITITICKEVHTMALIYFILQNYKEESNAGVGEIPEVKWDAANVGENVEFWLASGVLLKDRLLPMGEREAELARKGKLEVKVMEELRGVRDVLSGSGGSE